MKKSRNIIITLIMIGSILFDSFGALFFQPVFAQETGRDLTSLSASESLSRDVNGNKTIFNDVLLTLNGEEVTSSNPLKKGDTFQIEYAFSLPDDLGKEMQDGDYFKFTLPTDFIALSGQSGDLKDPSTGLIYGNYACDSAGNVTMTFNSEVQKHDNVEGRLRFSLTMDERKITIPGKKKIIIPWSNDAEGKEIFISTKITSFIQKEYLNTRYDSENEPIVDWKILINPNRNLIENPTLTEETTNSEWKKVASAYNITKMVKANVDLDGNITENEDVTGLINFDPSGVAHFPSNIEESFVLYLSTPINYAGQGTITNKITLSGSNRQDEEATASTSLEEHVDISKKAGDFDEKTQEITWTVTFNPSGRHIPKEEAKFTDIVGSQQDFIKDSLTVSPFAPYTVTEIKEGFEFQFEQDVDQPIDITYKTKVTYRPREGTSISNTVYHGKHHISVPKEIPGTGEEPPEPESTVSKDYVWDQQSNELDWTILFNQNNRTISKWFITDKLSTGYIFDQTILVTDRTSNKQLIENQDYSLKLIKENGEVKGFEIRYLSEEETNHTFQINYKSHFDDNVEHMNNCIYRYTQGGEEKEGHTGKVFFRQKNSISANKFGTYLPETQEVEWRIGVNEIQYKINKNSIIEDPIPDDQEYVEGSVEILQQEFEGTSYKPTEKATVRFDQAENKIKANFDEGAKYRFLIVFRTTLKNKEDILKKKIKNVAYYEDDYTPRKAVEASVDYSVGQEMVVRKEGEISKEFPNRIKWKVIINEHKFDLKNVEIEDYKWFNNRALFDTMKLVYTSGENKGKILEKGIDYTFDHTERSFHIKLANDLKDTIELTYDAEITYSKRDIPGDEIVVTNSVRVSGSDFIITDEPKTKSVPVIVPKSSGEIIGTTEQLDVFKVIKGTQTPLPGAVFVLYRGEKKDNEKIVERITTDQQSGRAVFSSLIKGNYLLVEEKAPKGYAVSPEFAKGIVITVTADKDNEVIQRTIENEKRARETTEINGKKIWNDYQNKFKTRPESITVRLYQNDKEYQVQEIKPDKSGDWTYNFTNLPKYDTEGNEYNYTLKEDSVKDYETKIEGTTITNSYENKETTEISGKKVWNDYQNKFKTRPESITVRLYQNDKEYQVQEVKATETGDWSYSFTNLPKYDTEGNEYSYTVKEDPVKDYETKIEGTTITNSYENKETTEINGKKIWNDYQNKFKTRPESITVRLYQNDKEYQVQEVKATETGDWSYSFTNLPKYDSEGNEYSYTVKEDPVKDYETKIEGTTITNSYENKETTEISGEKIWNDYQNKFKTRPESITVRLYQNDKEYQVQEVKATETGDWSYSFTNLPKYDSEGNEYNYTLKEDPVKDYETKIEGTTITNSYENKETTEISGEKIWNDYQNKFKTRPESITVRLYQNEKEYQMQEVKATETGDWSYSFTNLPKYDSEGNEYNYTLKEDPVKEYETKIEGTTITNSYENKETTEISGKKVWNDYQNKFKTRPESITVRLYQNDKEYQVQEVKADENNDWSYSFTNLPKYDSEGNEYNYTVKEDPVKDYETKIEGTTITNSYTNKETTEISGEKIWEDYQNKFKTRPESITVRLYQNDKEYQVQEVKADESGDWSYSFTNLPKYDSEGNEYSYTVKEDPVKDYETKIEGTTITNSYTNKETTEISGKKIWNDYKNKFRTRTNSITIRLYQNDKEFKKQAVKANLKTGDWNYTFTDLPKYDAKGNEYIYTLKEDPVKEYKTRIDGTTIINTYVNNETTEVAGKKVWEDYQNKFKTRPESITVRLYQNDQEYQVQEIKPDKSGDWTYNFTNLPKYDTEGNEYSYTLKEDPVKEYETKIEGTTITNTYENKETTEISGKKIWEDYQNKFQTRPESITVRLYQNEKEYQMQEVKADESGDWSYSFTNLPKYDSEGNEYNYTLKEDPVKDYKTKIEGTTITNTYENKETTEISGKKIWEDYQNKFKTRPESITVRLYQNNKEYKVQEVKTNKTGDWNYTFSNLPKYDTKGNEYNYTVKEDQVKNYESKVEGTTITNTYTNKETTEISGEKIWNDDQNKFKARPDAITIRLYQNNKEYKVQEVKANETGDWNYTFSKLPKYDTKGNEYRYTIKEDPVTGYETKIEGTTIINTYIQEEPTTSTDIKQDFDKNEPVKHYPKTGSIQRPILKIVGIVLIILMGMLWYKKSREV
ncbi:Cna B-type domain-containing protein [Candidatus Enterococcus ikei]|uniref:Cna B-type domain-containing protein n=1 Tax=Candidatus Enterococcus ikei TaxID=2815326 RepID=A0ABS3H0U5_9ENTE|nr:Cna B-type domain-containing protein [Enterococcus sp. DIV0869a]MBO0440789.1 Cna B-type domain-containing protein [Enterococcus sp. DIV0869a]